MQLERTHSIAEGGGPPTPALSHTKSLPARMPLSVRIKPSCLKTIKQTAPPKIGLQSVCFNLEFEAGSEFAFATMEQVFVYETEQTDSKSSNPVDIEYLFPSPGSGMPILGFECQINGNQLQTKVDSRSNIDELANKLTQQKITNVKLETSDHDGSDDLVVVTIGSMKPADVLTVRVEFGLGVPSILGTLYRVTIPVVLLPRVLHPRPFDEQYNPQKRADFSKGTKTQNLAPGVRLGIASSYTLDFNLTAENPKDNLGRWELRFSGYDHQIEKNYSGSGLIANFSNLRAQSPNIDLDFDLEWKPSFTESFKDQYMLRSPNQSSDEVQSFYQVFSPAHFANQPFPISGVAEVHLVSRNSQQNRLEQAQMHLLSNPNLRDAIPELDTAGLCSSNHPTIAEGSTGSYSQLFLLVLDHSQFVKQTKLDLLLRSVKSCLRMLPPTSWVSLAHIGLHFEWINQAPALCEPDSIEELCHQLDEVYKLPSNSLGGLDLTVLPDALQEMSEITESTSPQLLSLPKQVLLFTTGNMHRPDSVCRHILTSMHRMPHGFRLSTVGIGGGSVYCLLTKLAHFGSGVHEVVTDAATVSRRMFYLLFRLTSPVLDYPQVRVGAELMHIRTLVNTKVGVLAEEPFRFPIFPQAVNPFGENLEISVVCSKKNYDLKWVPCKISSSCVSRRHRANIYRLICSLDSPLEALHPKQSFYDGLAEELAISYKLLTSKVGFIAYNEDEIRGTLDGNAGLDEASNMMPMIKAYQKIVVEGTIAQDYLKKAPQLQPTAAAGLFSNARLGPTGSTSGSIASGVTSLLSDNQRRRVEEEAEKAKRSHPKRDRPRNMLGSVAGSVAQTEQAFQFGEDAFEMLGQKLSASHEVQSELSYPLCQSKQKRSYKERGELSEFSVNPFSSHTGHRNMDTRSDIGGSENRDTDSPIVVSLATLSLAKLTELASTQPPDLWKIQTAAVQSFGIRPVDWVALFSLADRTTTSVPTAVWLLCHVLDLLRFLLGAARADPFQLTKNNRLLEEVDGLLYLLGQKFPGKLPLKVQIEISAKLRIVNDLD